MSLPSFVSSFAGAALSAPTNTSWRTPRCAMRGDYEGPKITVIPGTKPDGTVDEASCKLNVTWETLAAPLQAAGTITGNQSLLSSLKPGTATSSPTIRSRKPEGVSPADWYFPPATRDQAPIVSMDYNKRVSVAYEEINPLVGGQSANDAKKGAFWKQKTYKYSAADLPEANSPTDAPIETSEFEKYFPTARRYYAPGIEIKAPAGDWDSSAYLVVKNEYVRINPAAARGLALPGQDANDMDPDGAVVALKYFGEEAKAPLITIGQDSVSVGMETVTAPEEKAEGFRLSPLYQDSVVAEEK